MKSKLSLRLMAVFGLISMAIVFMPPNQGFAATTQRLEAADRYGTAIAISQTGWKVSENVVLATGQSFPDALSAATLAKQLDAPILLIGKTLTKELNAELARLQAKNVFIVGGEGVISKEIKTQLETEHFQVARLAGADRYATSLEIARYMTANFKVSSEIVVATGEGFPDALSIAPVAAAKGMPIVLSQKNRLPEDVKEFIAGGAVTKAFVIGGTGVISEQVMNQLPVPERIGGSDRYRTNIAVLNRFADDLSLDKVYIATGKDFPDALAGSALAPKASAPIILVDQALPIVTADYLYARMSLINEISILGGQGAVSSTVLTDNVYGNTSGNITNMGFVAVQGDWIYYHNDALYKVKADGSGKQELSKDIPGFINVAGDWVYYADAADQKLNMYKIKTDGTSRTKLSDDQSMYIVVAENWIYYMNASDSGNLYKIKTDGTAKTKLTDEPALEISVSGDWVYYTTINTSGQGELHKIKTDGTGSAIVYEGGSMMFLNVAGDDLYFEVADSSGENTALAKVKRKERIMP